MSAAAVEALLHQARLARARRDLDSAERALAEAAVQPVSPALRTRVYWKWAKVLADSEQTTRALQVLALAETPLFDAYPQAFRGARRLARLHQERVGYAEDALPWLWTELLNATRSHHGPDATELVRLDRAWCYACRGEISAMEKDLDRVHHREDAAHYTRLCAANWALDPRPAAESAPELEPGSPHVDTALFEASLRFGLPAPPLVQPTPYLQALARGHGFADLPSTLRATGPEFALAAHQSAVLAGELDPPEERHGCAVFRFEVPASETR